MKHYGEKDYDHITANWDEMQKDLRLVEFQTGALKKYENMKISVRKN